MQQSYPELGLPVTKKNTISFDRKFQNDTFIEVEAYTIGTYVNIITLQHIFIDIIIL